MTDAPTEVATLVERLAVAEETLRAIRSGEIDALVVETEVGDRVFTLAGAERPYRVMIESMQEGAATVSDAGTVLYANHRLGDMLGRPLHDLIGRPAAAFAVPAERDRFQQLLRDASVGAAHGETTLQTDAGAVTASIAANPLDLDGGRAACLVITDLSQQKRTEQRLETTNAMLARRTRALARSNHELEQFAYIASHDLRAPLRTIRGFVDLLADALNEGAQERVVEYMGFIEDAAERMQHLIDDLLQFSRVGATGGQRVSTDAGEALEQVVASLHAAITETGATVTHDPLPTVTVDPVQFEQLLQNLIENALKFRGPGPPRIHVTAQRADEAWEFSVADNGIGLDPRFSDKIFVAFQQLHPHGAYPGTGIGLAICKKIVERHGGAIGVASAPGQGATFRFTIPDAGGPE